MWNTDTFWFDLALYNGLLVLGQILLGHFEERTPRSRKLLKNMVFLALFCALLQWFGRTVAYSVLGIFFLLVLYIHIVWLRKKGINGWTGEPKSRYYELRGWDKDVFKES